jgi:hypothetical protein
LTDPEACGSNLKKQKFHEDISPNQEKVYFRNCSMAIPQEILSSPPGRGLKQHTGTVPKDGCLSGLESPYIDPGRGARSFYDTC